VADHLVPDGKSLVIDANAATAGPGLPAFLARPQGAPVYHGFPLIEETRTDGWCFGAITEFAEPDGCDCGDGFVVAPDGSRAGIIWEVGEFPIEQTLPPEPGRWGVWFVPFPKPVRNVDDLVECFRFILPELQKLRESIAVEDRG
jgi:hypothetical protein